MKVLIQDPETRRYLAADGSWTTDAASGEDFRSHRYAVACARHASSAACNIVLHFPFTGCSLCVDHARTEAMISAWQPLA